MNAEAARMFAPQIQAMNDRGRAVQKAQGGTIPEMGTVPIPTTPNPSAAYHEGGAVTKSIVPKARKQPPAWMNQIEMREGGLKREIYIDSEGYPTVGIGHRLPDEYKSKKGQVLFSDDQLNKWFTEDIAKATTNASDNISNFDSLDSNVQGALINQAFQLGGTGQKGFEKMIKAIEDGDMNKAASEALDSNWFSQTPKRALDLASILRGEEPKMEYNKGGPVPRYYGLGSFVRSLFGTDDDDDRFTMPDATALSGTPNYMFSNKNDIVVPPNVQTKINTDGSWFNSEYAGEPLHMGDSNFDVPEPPKFSDQDLIQNSSNALKDVPLISLKDDDLGALKELGNDDAEDILKQRRIANEYGSYVPTNFNPERRRLEDEAYNRFGMNLNDDNTLSPVEKPVNLDPRIGVSEYYGVPKDYGSGMSLNEDARASLPPRFMDPRTRKIPTGPASYDQMPPRRTADIDIGEGSFGYGQFKRPDDPTFKQLIRDGEGNNVLRGDLGMPMDPVNVDSNDPRVGVPEYYGVPKVNESKRGRIGEKVEPVVESTFLANATPEQIDQYNTEKERRELEKKTIGKTGLNVNEAERQEIYKQKVLEAEEFIETGSEEAFAKAKNEKERLEVVEKIKKANALIANSKTKARIEANKDKLLKRGQATQINQELDSKISALQKELGTATDPNHKAFLEKEIDRLQGNKVDTTTDVLSKDDSSSDGGNVSPKNSPEVNLDNSEKSNNQQLENDPTIEDKGKNAPPEVKAAAVDEIKSVFGEMFDVEELTRMAILYLGARATGASGSQAMAFAGKSYLSRLDNKYKQNKFNEHYNSLLKGNNFTRDSMELYKYTKDPNVLVTKSSLRKGSVSGDPKGEVFYTKANVRGVRGQKLRLFKNDEVDSTGKKTGNTFYTTSDGTPISQQQLEMYFTTDESTIPETDAYIKSRNEVATGIRPVIKEKIDMFKPTDTNEGNPAMYKIVGNHKEKITMEVAKFSKDLQLKEGQMVTANIIENAFGKLQDDIDDGFYDDVSTITFTDYLDRAYIGTKVGNEKYFTYETSNGKSKTDSAKDVDIALDGLTRGVKSKGGGKWINTPPIVINDLLLRQAKIKLGNGEGSMNDAERAKFNAAYEKSIKTKPQSKMLFYLETEINELNYDDYFKR
jgi:GH24 family phage-related lysozyme (muramidase)